MKLVNFILFLSISFLSLAQNTPKYLKGKKNNWEILFSSDNRFLLSYVHSKKAYKYKGKYTYTKDKKIALFPSSNSALEVYAFKNSALDSGKVMFHIDKSLIYKIGLSNESDHLKGEFSFLYDLGMKMEHQDFLINKFYDKHFRVKFPLMQDTQTEKLIYNTIAVNFVDSFNHFLLLPSALYFDLYQILPKFGSKKYDLRRIDGINALVINPIDYSEAKLDTDITIDSIINKSFWNNSSDTILFPYENKSNINSYLLTYRPNSLFENSMFVGNFFQLAPLSDKFFTFKKIQEEVLNEKIETYPIYKLDYNHIKSANGFETKLKEVCLNLDWQFLSTKTKIVAKQKVPFYTIRVPLDYENTEEYIDFQLEYYKFDKIKAFPIFDKNKLYISKVLPLLNQLYLELNSK